jgi:hypothetical protein
VARLEAELERKDSKVADLKKARQQLYDKLLAIESGGRSADEARISAEVLRLQAAAQADLERIRVVRTWCRLLEASL